MEVFTHGVGTAQTVHAVIDGLLASQPGITGIAEAVEAVDNCNKIRGTITAPCVINSFTRVSEGPVNALYI